MRIDVTRFGSTHYEYVHDWDPRGRIHRGDPIEIDPEDLLPLQCDPRITPNPESLPSDRVDHESSERMTSVTADDLCCTAVRD